MRLRLPRRPRAHREENLRLRLLAAAPSMWAVHFLASYATAAIWCAKAASRDAPLDTARLAIGAYTLAAFAGIALVTWRGLRLLHVGEERLAPPHAADTAADRDRFLGFATLLLCGLSFVAVLYAALPAAFVEDCR